MSRAPIIPRLDAIENARRKAAASHYARTCPGLEQSEIRRLADLMAATPTRLIAESALALLPAEQSEALLGRFESGC